MSESDVNPPPYSATVDPSMRTPNEYARPFSNSEQTVVQIQSLIVEGSSLESCSREIHTLLLKTDRENQSGQLQVLALELRQNLTTQLWGCRESAGIARAAVKEFNENVLDVLSEPDVEAQVRLNELVGVCKVMRQQAQLVTVQRQRFGSLVADFDIFSRMVLCNVNELTAEMDHVERASNGSAGNTSHGESSSVIRTRHPRHASEMPVHPYPQRKGQQIVHCRPPSTGLSTQVAFGTLTFSDPTPYLQKFEQRAEETLASFYRRVTKSLSGQPGISPTRAARRPKPELKRSQLATLHTLVDGVLRDLRSFCDRLVLLEDIFEELQQEHDILVLYIKDGRSVAHREYRSEINRLRKHLLPICQALGAFTKARLS